MHPDVHILISNLLKNKQKFDCHDYKPWNRIDQQFSYTSKLAAFFLFFYCTAGITVCSGGTN